MTIAVPSTFVDTVSTQLDVLPDMSDTSVSDVAAEVGAGGSDVRAGMHPDRPVACPCEPGVVRLTMPCNWQQQRETQQMAQQHQQQAKQPRHAVPRGCRQALAPTCVVDQEVDAAARPALLHDAWQRRHLGLLGEVADDGEELRRRHARIQHRLLQLLQLQPGRQGRGQVGAACTPVAAG